jgi:ribose transport system substrate-binding protein
MSKVGTRVNRLSGRISRATVCSMIAATVAVAAFAGISGARADATNHTKVIGFSLPYADVPIVTAINKLIVQRATERGYKVLLDSTQGGALQGQQATLDSWIDQKVDAIMAYAINPPALVAIGRRAKAAGIVFTAYGAPVDGAQATIDFGVPEGARRVTNATIEWINSNDPKAEVILLSDSQNQATAARTSVPTELIPKMTKATIVATQDAVAQEKGFEVVSTILQAHPNVSVVVGLNDDGALGAARAFKQAGKDPSKVFIIGTDGSKPAIEELLKNDPKSFFKASAALDLRKLTAACVDTMIDMAEKGAPAEPLTVSVPPDVVTSKDVDHLKALLANLGG